MGKVIGCGLVLCLIIGAIEGFGRRP